MLQESTTSWDLRAMVEISPAERLYMLFLLLVFIVGLVELIRTWRLIPSSKVAPDTQSAARIKQLRNAATKLKQWIYITFLACGFFTSYELYHVSDRLLTERIHSGFVELWSFQGLFVLLEMTFLVAIFVFLVRWHIVKRIAKLGD
ncbi:MAG TPA: hypothetical protein VJY15_23825 [Candidatus Acidoferrum sp.]|nr:hypothetical protein [Candidatus Acidoferrum sp.]